MNVNNTLGERNPHCTIPVQWGIHAMGVDPAPSEPPPGLVSRARGGRHPFFRSPRRFHVYVNMLIITLTASSRPGYLRDVLGALSRCDGVDDVLLLPHVEPGNDEVRALIESVSFCPCESTWNPEQLGVNRNTHDALADGFARGDVVLHLEDDVVPARDCLTYFRHVAERYRSDPAIWTATGYNRLKSLPSRNEWRTLQRRSYFHAWSWLTWRDRWDKMADHALWRATDLTWDCRVCEAVKGTGLSEVYPILSRVQNIGLTSSIHTNLPRSFFAENHRLKVWAGQVGVPSGEFTEQGENEVGAAYG